MKKTENEPEKIVLKNKMKIDESSWEIKERIINSNIIARGYFMAIDVDYETSKLITKEDAVFGAVLNEEDKKIDDILLKMRSNLTEYKYYSEKIKDKFQYITNYTNGYNNSLTSEEIGLSSIVQSSLKKMGILKPIPDTSNLQSNYKLYAYYDEMYNKYLNELFFVPYSSDELDNIMETDFSYYEDKLKDKYEIEDNDKYKEKIYNNKQELLNYMKEIIIIETNIYSLNQRYKDLQLDLKVEELLADCETFNLNYKILNKKVELNNNIATLNNELIKIIPPQKSCVACIHCGNEITKDSIVCPSCGKSPIDDTEVPIKPSKPKEPINKKPGLFNKKKVNEENELLKEKYEKSLKIYNKKLSEYKKAKSNYELEMKKNLKTKYDELNKTNELNYKKAMDKYNEQKSEISKKIDKANHELKILEDGYETENLNEIEHILNIEKIKYEMNYILELLEDNVKLRNEIYSYNIIYGKYRNIIAVSRFIDYFESGRCEKLDGADGAYNMYEQEIRADTIIEQLDKITENQYYLYKELKEVNKSLREIQNELIVSNIKMDTIAKNTEKLVYNTNEMAFYTKKIANYSKVMTYIKVLEKL